MKPLKDYNQFINEKYLVTKYSAGLAIIFDGQILLGQSRGRKEGTGYGISKGGIEEGESHLDAAIRETYEEFGIKVPKSLINTTEHTLTLTSRKYKYNKVVYYFIVEIDDLSKIGLKDLVIPKRQLQLEEIDNARFMDKIAASKVIMLSQHVILKNLIAMGLL